MRLSYTNIRCEKAKVAHERNPGKHILEAVGILKQATDKEDKYHIYKLIIKSLMENQITYLKAALLWLSWQ